MSRGGLGFADGVLKRLDRPRMYGVTPLSRVGLTIDDVEWLAVGEARIRMSVDATPDLMAVWRVDGFAMRDRICWAIHHGRSLVASGIRVTCVDTYGYRGIVDVSIADTTTALRRAMRPHVTITGTERQPHIVYRDPQCRCRR